MIRHRVGESKDEREYRRTVEINNKTLADLHIDQNKFYENNARRQGEKYRHITTKFSDKEQEEAAKVMKIISLPVTTFFLNPSIFVSRMHVGQ